MTTLQSLLLGLLPRAWSKDIEESSRAWKVSCGCGYEQSVWDWGGIRWKAAGNPRRYLRCPQCGQASWHTVAFKPDTVHAKH